jgi:Domain of unknown function (DUF4145)
MSINSWWQLGEGTGQRGPTLAVWSIECAFCGEEGHFERVFHGEKRKPGSTKKLNFDVYKCTNCAGFVHVLWSAADNWESLGEGMHAFMVLPWPLSPTPRPSPNISAEMARFWTQAHQSLASEAWDAASVMARSALQLALRENGATGTRLVDQIQDLANKGLLPPPAREWATEVRLLGNDAAHPAPGQVPAEPTDVQQCVDFLDFFLYCLYDLPAKVAEHRARRTQNRP